MQEMGDNVREKQQFRFVSYNMLHTLNAAGYGFNKHLKKNYELIS